MKKFLIPFMSLFILSSTPYCVYAQSNVEKAAAVGIGLLGTLLSSKKSKKSNKSDNPSTETSYNSATTTNSAYTQEDGIKIVTNHPDFKIKVKRCAASGNTVIIDMTLHNNGTEDVSVLTYGGIDDVCEAYDDEGNIFKGDNIKVKVSNRQDYSYNNTGEYKILVGVPMKLYVQISGVPNQSQSISRLTLLFKCPTWGLGWDKLVKLSNIPISRE